MRLSKNDINIKNISNKDILVHDKELKELDILLKRLNMIIDSHCHLTYEPMSLSLSNTMRELIKKV